MHGSHPNNTINSQQKAKKISLVESFKCFERCPDLERLGSREECWDILLTEADLTTVDEGEEGGEVAAIKSSQVETELTGGELGQDGAQCLAVRGENHLVCRVAPPVTTQQGHVTELAGVSQ